MSFGVDIHETVIRDWGHGIIDFLLMDQTTKENIIWATDDYSSRGEGYCFHDNITSENVCGEGNHIIQPRISKSLAEQKKRIVDKAEVFTPSWVCNSQNNVIDKAWFQTEKDVFNHETEENGNHFWEMIEEEPVYPDGKKWRDYVADTRLEMACGEAPYLCSRYDATTGEMIPVERRVGLLDRKLMIVNANTPNITPDMSKNQCENVHRRWSQEAYKALQSTYGFEWQGDNLLLARESVLITFIEYYQAKWRTDRLPDMKSIEKAAEIISWNIWQMDGLKYGIPGYKPKEQKNVLFSEPISPRERFCVIKEWKGWKPLSGEVTEFRKLLNQ